MGSRKPWYRRWWVWVVGVVLIAGIASAGSSTESGDDGGDGPAQVDRSAAGRDRTGEPEDCGTTATDDCTPHVGSTGSVRVDALTWRVTSIRGAKTLGDRTYGLGEEADGTFVVVKLEVRSDRDESATLTDGMVKLRTEEGNTYDPDLDGTTAVLGTGDEPFFLETLGPDATTTGTVVFDVPDTALGGGLELQFGELGLGSTKGYIRVPRSKIT